MELRKIHDEAEARAALAAAGSSGLPRRTWARQNGLDPRSLHAWHLNLSRRLHAAEPLRLVELHVAHARPVYTLILGDVRLEVSDDFREDTLRRLLGVLC